MHRKKYLLITGLKAIFAPTTSLDKANPALTTPLSEANRIYQMHTMKADL